METQASENGFNRLLRDRSKRYRSGGVGLVMTSQVERSGAWARLARRNRVLAIGLVACLAGLFTAGGYASARMWDGHGSKHLALQMAIDTAEDDQRRDDLRQNGLGSVSSFASSAVKALLELQQDEELGGSATIYLNQLRKLLPEPGSTSEAIARSKDGNLPVADREEALRRVSGAAFSAMVGLRDQLGDAQLSALAHKSLERLHTAAGRALADSR